MAIRKNICMLFALSFLVIFVLCTSNLSFAEDTEDDANLPQYLSLRAHEVNMRAGPGAHYPIEWVYQKKGLPMEVLAKFNHWRKVRDWQGSVGWIHRSLLSTSQYILIQNNEYKIYKKRNLESRPVARLSPGVIAYIKKCEDKNWCYIQISGYKGWLQITQDMWGLELESN